MASTVYTMEEIQLSDGTVLELRPLPIKYLKKFMAVIESMKQDDTELDSINNFATAARICLEPLKIDLATDVDKFEEIIDQQTMVKIIEVCGGLKLTDPNLLGANLVGTI